MPNLMEKIMMISLESESGKVSKYAHHLIRFGLAGAVLFELQALKRIEIREKKVIVLDSSATVNEVLNDALDVLNKSKGQKSLFSWIFNSTGFIKKSRNKILNTFVDNGWVKDEEKRILGLIPIKRYPVTHVKLRKDIESDIRGILLKDDKQVEKENVQLVSLVVASNAVGIVLNKEDKKNVKEKIKMIAKANYFSTGDEALGVVLQAISKAIAAQNASGS